MTKTLLAGAAALGLAACTSTGNVERNAGAGAVLGGVAGAAVGNNVGDGDAKTGAAIGAVLGGAAGAARGANQDREAEIRGYGDRTYDDGAYTPSAQAERYYDRDYDRYYTVDPRTGDTYWTNGQLRSRG